MEQAKGEHANAGQAPAVVTAREQLEKTEQERLEAEQAKQAADREVEQAKADMDGLASTGADTETAMGLMAIMALVGGGCVLLRRRID